MTNQENPSSPSPGSKTASGAFDRQALLTAFDNDWEFLTETIDMFVDDYPAMMENIQAAISSKDATGLRQTAHALKGMVGNFQAKSTAQAAFTLEERGKQNDFDRIDDDMAVLKNKMTDLEQALTALAKEEAP